MRQPRLVTFDAAVFSLLAVKKAAYRYSDRVAINIRAASGEICCDLEPLDSSASEEDVSRLEAAFKAEVLDMDLREVIARETAVERNLILSLAFSATSLQQSE